MFANYVTRGVSPQSETYKMMNPLILLTLGFGGCALVYKGFEADQDGDGLPEGKDCNDNNSQVGSDRVDLYVDGDGDGFGAGALQSVCAGLSGYADNNLDCDDTSPTVYPDAPETDGDAADSDCDDCRDNYATRYWDGDGDGHGDPDLGESICPDDPEGYVESADDCDDENGDIYPESTEYCNETDDDCDGLTDEEAVDQTTWYVDSDEDGFGEESTEFQSCEEWGEGYSQTAGDCDDSNSAFYPGASTECLDQDANCDGISDAEDGDGDGYLGCEECDDLDPSVNPAATEICDDLDVDEDCDGLTDDDDESVDFFTKSGPYYVDSDGDSYGTGTASYYCDPDPTLATADGDCDDGDANSYPGATETPYDGTDQDCADGDLTDVDGDGYASIAVAGGTDCDDSDTAIYPGASETAYDGVDQDCDGADLTDVDGDGYDSTAVSGGTDCDDDNASINPGASEACDSSDTDEDCDGLADDDDPEGAVGKVTRYEDADSDGYGDLDTEAEYCDPDAAVVSDGSDCDDGDISISPAEEEVCLDSIDNNCDGNTDVACEENFSDGDYIIEGSVTNGYAGRALAGVGDLNGDGLADLAIGVPYDDTVCLVGDPLSSGALSAVAYACPYGPPASYVGWAMAPGGDMDGDGNDDLLLGAPGIDGTYGAVIALSGPVSTSYDVNGTSLAQIRAESDSELGYDVAGGRDTDGDGNPDVLAGAPLKDSSKGVAYLIFGPMSGFEYLANHTDLLTQNGEDASDSAGVAVALADLDGDGLADAVVGSPSHTETVGSEGIVYVTHNLNTGTMSLGDTDAKLTGEAALDSAGTDVTSAGDLDGDGYEDLAVGAPNVSNATTNGGAVYILYGPVISDRSLATADATLEGDTADGFLGTSVGGGMDWDGDGNWDNDVDGDGLSDILVGAPGTEGSSLTGTAYLIYGNLITGTIDIDTDTAIFNANSAGDWGGRGLSFTGDLDGDSYNEFSLAAPSADNGASNGGVITINRGTTR